MKKSLFIILFIFSISLVLAHQPNIVYEKASPFFIYNPEISQAFYGELKGMPEYYIINSSNNFDLYLQMLSPDIKDAREDFVFEVTHENKLILLEGNSHNWTRFHEEFANDNYLSGPELEINNTQGLYKIKVSNSDNKGKYVLVVGRKEAFPLSVTIATLWTIPQLKIYFNKPFFYGYFTIISLFFFWPALIIIISLIFFIRYLIKRLNNKKIVKKSPKKLKKKI